ncbi:MAG: 2-oxoacid:ferredoxin oxidoreductase subunit beta [Candidatus Poribacteria bacterium]|nr:2-oxoacid:ferredoxin oxidoreductase subunit beta [Candidatus Poribacteria bacterium]
MARKERPAKRERPIKGAPTARDFQGDVNPDWCPGCGDYSVLRALQTAYAKSGRGNHEHMTVSGIGCSSNLPGYVRTYGMHTLHGRSLAVATGAKLANHQMNVVVTGGDGDGYGIGGNHFVHTMRKNIDLLYIVMNNQIYGLTIGQASPTSMLGMETKSTPFGNIEAPLNPIAMAIVTGATYVARGFSGDQKQLTDLMYEGMQHRGFALIDVFSPCITFNKDNTYDFFKPRVQALENHDPSDQEAALKQAVKWGDEIPIGLFYQDTSRPALDEMEPVLENGPMAHQSLGITEEQGDAIIRRMM